MSQYSFRKKKINHCSSRIKVVFSLCFHHTHFSQKVRGSHGFQVAKLGKEGTKKTPEVVKMNAQRQTEM